MATRKSFFINPLAICSIAAVMALAVACGDDDDSNETPGSGNKSNTEAGTPNDDSKAGESGGGKSGSGGGGTGGSTAGTAGTTPTSDAGAGGGGDAVQECVVDKADKNCVTCNFKVKLPDYLNACPTTGSTSYDNTKLTAIKNGKLPDLP